MKNLKMFALVFFCFDFAGTISVSAQSSCSCSNSGCSASQSCPDGYIAVCTCSATGCSSSCNRAQLEIELSENVLATKLQNESAKNIGSVLSKAFGKFVTFEPTNPGFRFEYSKSNSLTASHWDILEYLARNGSLKINGHDLEFWRGLRQTLLKGGEFTFCTGSALAQMILAEISFITGRKFRITSGDPKAKVSVAVRGFSLSEILEALSKSSQTTIVEN
jgi:hypothetical protein